MEIVKAEPKDLDSVTGFIRALAEYEQIPDQCTFTRED